MFNTKEYRIKKQFDEISSMLDSIRGGRSSNGLFDINVDTEATEL